jgi:hypothetical protein
MRRQDEQPQAPLSQDVLQQARFPALLQAAAARRVAAQMLQARRQDVQRWLKQETQVQPLQASQTQALRHLDGLQDELPSRRRVRQVARHPEPSPDQPPGRAPQHPASRQSLQERQAPRRQQQASHPQLQAQQESPRQASPLASSLP